MSFRTTSAHGQAAVATLVACLGLPALAQDGAAQDGDIALVSQPEENVTTAFISHFDDMLDAETREREWYISNFARAAEDFRTAWRYDSVRLAPEDSGLVLGIRPGVEESDKDFFGAEVQRQQRTHYGRYEVVMTAARGEGIISSFFTYTGPYFGDPHDEIDFEFLGIDTTKVWINRFVDGERLPGRWIDLGFDAADAPHTYAFDWLPDRIVWYADGEEIFRVTADERGIPSTPGKIYINIWGGGERQEGWSGIAPDDASTEARYYCMSYRPMDSDAPTCSMPDGVSQDG